MKAVEYALNRGKDGKHKRTDCPLAQQFKSADRYAPADFFVVQKKEK